MEDQNKQPNETGANPNPNPNPESNIGGGSDPAAAPQEPISATPNPNAPAGSADGAPDGGGGGNVMPFVIGLVVLVAAAGLAYYFFSASGDGTAVAPNGNGAPTENATFDADQVVARVNGEELRGDDLAYQMIQVAQSAGLPSVEAADPETLQMIQSQSLDAIVNTELLLQEAQSQGLTVDEAEVESQFATIIESIGGQETADERLAALGITEAEFKVNLADDLLIQKYIAENQGESVLEVTEEEVQAFYAQVSEGQEEVPPLEEVRGQIEEQLRFQKEQEALTAMVEQLRAEADIEMLI